MLIPPCGIWIPLISSSLLISLAKGSVAIEYNNADSGHPCLTDLSKGKESVKTPLIFTQMFELLYNKCIHLNILESSHDLFNKTVLYPIKCFN